MATSTQVHLKGGGVVGHAGKEGRELLQGRAGPGVGRGHEGQEAVQETWRLGQGS